MSFFKRIFGSNPREQLRKSMLEFTIPAKAFNIYESFSTYSKHDIDSVVSELIRAGSWEDNFLGNQGWYLTNLQKTVESFVEKLKKGPMDLEEKSGELGLNQKRLYIIIEDRLGKESLVRKESMLFLTSYLRQKWIDTVATADLENEEDFETIFSRINIDPEFKDLLKRVVYDLLKSGISDIALGQDSKLRRKSVIAELLPDFIIEKWENGSTELKFSEISDYYGITIEETSSIITELMTQSKLVNCTIYPVDELLKPKI